MHSHFLYLLLVAAAFAVVLGALLRDDAREAARLALWIVLGLVGGAVLLAWALYLIPS